MLPPPIFISGGNYAFVYGKTSGPDHFRTSGYQSITFILLQVVPGDPVAMMLEKSCGSRDYRQGSPRTGTGSSLTMSST